MSNNQILSIGDIVIYKKTNEQMVVMNIEITELFDYNPKNRYCYEYMLYGNHNNKIVFHKTLCNSCTQLFTLIK